MNYEQFCSQLSTDTLEDTEFRSKRTLRLCLKAAGQTETTQDWLELDEGDPGFQLMTHEEITAVIYFFIYFHQHYIYY
jgi:hypothetical protein